LIICVAPLLAAIEALVPTQGGGCGVMPTRDAARTVTPPPATLVLLRAARPSSAQRVVPGLH